MKSSVVSYVCYTYLANWLLIQVTCWLLCNGVVTQVAELQAKAAQLQATNQELRQQLAASEASQAELQQLQGKLAQAAQLSQAVEHLTAENAEVGASLALLVLLAAGNCCAASL